MTPAAEISADGARLTVHLPMKIRRRGGWKVVMGPDGNTPAPARSRVDSTLVKTIARAYRWQRMLEEGEYASMRDLAAAEKISPTYISRLLRLTLLAPEVVEKVLNGEAPETQGWPAIDQLWCEQMAAIHNGSLRAGGSAVPGA